MSTRADRVETGFPGGKAFALAKIGASVTTGAFALMMAFSGVLYLFGARPVVHALLELGYPVYFSKMLGVAKILGAATLLAPRAATLREWAYAGFAFDLAAAVVSHLATRGYSHVPQPLAALALLATSYLLRRRLAEPSSVRHVRG